MIQALGGEGGCVHLGTLKWRLLKEPVDELLVRDKKHQLERTESLDKT